MRLLLRILGFVVLGAVALVALLGALAPWSQSGWFALGIVALAALALIIEEPKPRRGLALVSLLLLLILLVFRIVGAGDGMIAMHTLPGGDSARWLARLVDEQDLALVGARVLARQWRLPADERERLVPAMREAYGLMRRDDVVTPSPVLDTLLGRQGPAAFDTLVIEPRAEPKPEVPMKFAVLFLHGYAGSFTLECWLVARAAREIGALTVCPATDFSGHWQGAAGERLVRASLDYLTGRGIKRVFLAGLSNGAVGASALASRFASSLEGLILISGAPVGGGNAGLPTLLVHGTHDTVTPVAAARAFAERTHATFAGFDGGHFVLLTKRVEARQAIIDWLMHRTGYHVVNPAGTWGGSGRTAGH
jgi:pimeloyl-ACP methyl ester carboxylesterase